MKLSSISLIAIAITGSAIAVPAPLWARSVNAFERDLDVYPREVAILPRDNIAAPIAPAHRKAMNRLMTAANKEGEASHATRKASEAQHSKSERDMWATISHSHGNSQTELSNLAGRHRVAGFGTHPGHPNPTTSLMKAKHHFDFASGNIKLANHAILHPK